MSRRRDVLKSVALVILAACESTVARLRGLKVQQVATLDQVPRDGAFRTKLGDDPIIVLNDAGDIRTFVAVCTHEGCPLGWNPNQHLIRCPCHGSAFDLHGAVVNGPAKLPLTRLESFVERARVMVAIKRR